MNPNQLMEKIAYLCRFTNTLNHIYAVLPKPKNDIYESKGHFSAKVLKELRLNTIASISKKLQELGTLPADVPQDKAIKNLEQHISSASRLIKDVAIVPNAPGNNNYQSIIGPLIRSVNSWLLENSILLADLSTAMAQAELEAYSLLSWWAKLKYRLFATDNEVFFMTLTNRLAFLLNLLAKQYNVMLDKDYNLVALAQVETAVDKAVNSNFLEQIKDVIVQKSAVFSKEAAPKKVIVEAGNKEQVKIVVAKQIALILKISNSYMDAIRLDHLPTANPNLGFMGNLTASKLKEFIAYPLWHEATDSQCHQVAETIIAVAHLKYTIGSNSDKQYAFKKIVGLKLEAYLDIIQAVKAKFGLDYKHKLIERVKEEVALDIKDAPMAEDKVNNALPTT